MLTMDTFLASVAYSGLGVFTFALAFVLIDLLTPIKLWQEVTEKQNRAVAIMAGSVALSIAIIVAAAIHG